MVMINYASKEIMAKIVYYGPGLSGKTTNLEYVNDAVDPNLRGKMVSMATEGDRTLFFDLLPLDVGEIEGFKTRFQLYTVPGQVRYNNTRKLVLTGADAVVFVADSQKERLHANKESLENMKENMKEVNIKLKKTPWIIQYNKRDLNNILSVEELERVLNHDGVPHFEAVAVSGEGVMETLRELSNLLMDKIEDEGVEKLGAEGERKTRKPTQKSGVSYDDLMSENDEIYDDIEDSHFDFGDEVDIENLEDFEAPEDITEYNPDFDEEPVAPNFPDEEEPVAPNFPDEEEPAAPDFTTPANPEPPPKQQKKPHDDSLHIKTSEPNYASHIRESQYLNKATKEIFEIIKKYGLTMEEIWYIESKILNMYIDKRIRRHIERAKMILDAEGGQIFVLRSQDDFED